MSVCSFVGLLPDVVNTSQGRAHVRSHYHNTSEAEHWSKQALSHNRSNKEQLGPGRGYHGWAATERHLNMTTTRSRRLAEVIAAGRLPPEQARARQTDC